MKKDSETYSQAYLTAHSSSKNPTSQSTVSDEANKKICEALGCFAEATTVTKVKVGKIGVISLLLCQHCISKFVDK